MDRDLRLNSTANGHKDDARFTRDQAAGHYFMEMAAHEIARCAHDLFDNTDASMLKAAEAALKFSTTLPNDRFVIPEKSPNALGTGRVPDKSSIKQFPGDGNASCCKSNGVPATQCRTASTQ
jgi:hypothetical protein